MSSQCGYTLGCEFNDPGLNCRAPWFLRRIPAACGHALWAGYVSEGYVPGDLPNVALTTFE